MKKERRAHTIAIGPFVVTAAMKDIVERRAQAEGRSVAYYMMDLARKDALAHGIDVPSGAMGTRHVTSSDSYRVVAVEHHGIDFAVPDSDVMVQELRRYGSGK